MSIKSVFVRLPGLLPFSAALVCAPALAQGESPVEVASVDPMTAVPDPASVPTPRLAFSSTALDEADFDKYFYFHRQETPFETALADIRECDGFARGLSSGYRYQQVPYPQAFTAAGVVGGAIGSLMVEAVFGSAERRRLRRLNMRRCLGYKGYSRFGLQKQLWQVFNFEEGFSEEAEEIRQAMIAQQAKVASGPRPAGRELGL